VPKTSMLFGTYGLTQTYGLPIDLLWTSYGLPIDQSISNSFV